MIVPLSTEQLSKRLVCGCQSKELMTLKCSFREAIYFHLVISGEFAESKIQISLLVGQRAILEPLPFQAKH